LTRRGVVIGAVGLAVTVVLATAAIRSASSVTADSQELCGEHFVAKATFSGVGLPLIDGNGLSLELRYDVVFRSKEQPHFVQVVQDSRFLGEVPAGGLEDWSLFRTLGEWDAARRGALLAHVVEGGNPEVMLVSTLDEDAWPGAWWSDPGYARERALELGSSQGYAPQDLVWIQYWSELDDDGELLGFDRRSGRMRLVSSGRP